MLTTASVATAILYHWLGPAAFVCVVLLFVLAPVNYKIMQSFESTEDAIMKFKVTECCFLGLACGSQSSAQDKRIKSLTEILQGILVVKLFSWETHLREKVEAIRAKVVRAGHSALSCNAVPHRRSCSYDASPTR